MPPPKKQAPAQGASDASTNTDASGTVKTYSVVNAVNHDQELYVAGDPIDLDDKTAEPLLLVGAIAVEADDTTTA
jgi:hypothetical protein